MRRLSLLLALVPLAGCTTYATNLQNVPGQPVREVPVSRPGLMAGTGPESSDIVSIADQMTRSLLGAPVIANATRPPTVALLSLENRSRFPLASPDIFLNRLRGELNTRASGRMVFLARDRIDAVMQEQALQRSGQFTSDPTRAPSNPAGADYFLTGVMEGLTQATATGAVDDYMLYSFQMIDTRTSAIVWEGQFEVQRAGQNDSVYR